MYDEGEPDVFNEISDIKANLNYEMLLARQIDRCLYYRTTNTHNFFEAVKTLDMALVDLPNKPLRTEFDNWVDSQHADPKYPDCDYSPSGIRTFDNTFKNITKILSKHHMLFKSTLLEVNR